DSSVVLLSLILMPVSLSPVFLSVDARRSVGRRRKSERRLTEDVAPASRGANISIAEPYFVIERFPVVSALGPQEGSDHGRVSPNANCLIGILLTLVNHGFFKRFLQQIGLGVDSAVPSDEREIIGQNAIHRGRVIVFHRLLILGVERGDNAFIS